MQDEEMADTGTLLDLVRQLQEQLLSQRQTMEHLEKENQELKSPQARNAPEPARVQEMATTSTPRRKPLPIGEPFSGHKPSFRAWAVTVRHKITVDQDFIGGPREQFAFIWANLSTRVQNDMAAFYEKGGYNSKFNPDEFLKHLEFCYEDKHSLEKAQVRLERLRQGKDESFGDFFPRFAQTLTESGGDGWGQEQKILKLRGALNQKMRDIALNRGVTRTDYDKAVEAFQAIAVDMETASFERQWNTSYTPARDKDGDVQMTSVNRMESDKDPGSSSRRRREKGAARNRNTWIPEELFQQRRREGVCTRCGRDGHFARDCPNAISIQAAAVGSTGRADVESDPEN